MVEIDARTLAQRLKHKMDNPPRQAPSFYRARGKGDAWLAGYRYGLGQSRTEIALQVQEDITGRQTGGPGERDRCRQPEMPEVTAEMVERAAAYLAARMLYPPTRHLRGALAAALQEEGATLP